MLQKPKVLQVSRAFNARIFHKIFGTDFRGLSMEISITDWFHFLALMSDIFLKRN